MKEKSAFDILQDTLKELGFEPKTHVTGRDFIVPGSFSHTKFVLAEIGDAWFLASDSYGKSVSSTFTGLYAPIQLVPEAECRIFRRDWFDRFLVSGKQKTGVEMIDKSLTIQSSGWNPAYLLDSGKAGRFLDLNERIKPLKLIIQNDYLPLIPFRDKKVIGLETNRWLYYPKDVRTFIEGAKALIDSFRSV